MKVIIMAAGRGTRISRHLGPLPKCCLKVGQETVIERTIRLLTTLGMTNISIVVGYGADYVRDVLRKYKVKEFVNPFFDVTNSIASLWFARSELFAEEEIVLMNGDLFFEPSLLEQVMRSGLPAVLFADPNRIVEADYRLGYSKGILERYGKGLTVQQTTGEYIGIAKIAPTFLNTFRERLDTLIGQQKHALWWEDILFTLSSDKVPVYVEEVTNTFWAEVDYVEDYERIKAYISNIEGS